MRKPQLVENLVGPTLDYWVARAKGVPAERIFWIKGFKPTPWVCCGVEGVGMFRPSSCWVDGGPILDEERLDIIPPAKKNLPLKSNSGDVPLESLLYRASMAEVTHWHDGRAISTKRSYQMSGRTTLEAAMRCFVRSKFGLWVAGVEGVRVEEVKGDDSMPQGAIELERHCAMDLCFMFLPPIDEEAGAIG